MSAQKRSRQDSANKDEKPGSDKKVKTSRVVPEYTKLLLNNEWVDAKSGKTFDVENPTTQEKICSVAYAGKEDVDLAVQYAQAAFEGPWRKMSAYDRGQLIFKFANLIEEHADELADLESQDNGKPLSFSRNVDITLAIKVYRYYAGWCDKINGSVIPISGDYMCYTKQEPVGIVGQIIPWNFPLLMQAWKWAPALAAGCVSILKPAESTPLTAMRIGALAVEAGFPPGVVQIVNGYGDVGGAMCVHKGIDKIAFTGSTGVGYKIMQESHPQNLKRITLELGGKSPNIICHDANVDEAVKQAHLAVFLNQGQCCCAGSRTYVHESIYEEFCKKAVEGAKNIKVGDPFDAETNQGPQVNQRQFESIMDYIKIGQEQGATMLCGGQRWGDKGYFIQPTVFKDVTDDMKIAKEEIFGPVMQILKFSDYDDVIKRANDSRYGLAAGIMTPNIETYMKLANGIRAGSIYVNCYDVFDANAPFGGFKDSGIGRELGEPALRNYLENKTIIVKRSADTLP